MRYRVVGSGVSRQPTYAKFTAEIAKLLLQRDISVKERSMGSPGNRDSYHLDANFLDGGLHAVTGDYWCSAKGAWIHGTEALVWTARALKLSPPGQLRRKQAPSLPPWLVATYNQADYVVLGAQQISIRIGQTSRELVELLREHSVENATLVTASNPFSVPLPDGINLLRQVWLRQDVEEHGLGFLCAEGRDPAGTLPAEISYLVLGPTGEQMRKMLVGFQQHAIVHVSAVGVPELMFHP